MNRTKLILVGKTDKGWITEGFKVYEKRLKHYTKLHVIYVSAKAGGVQEQGEAEGKEILKKCGTNDYVVLLDEMGKSKSSKEFAQHLERIAVRGIGEVTFVIGGAYGFSKEVYERADYKISLSPMTFTHQMVRVIFMEQLYRAFTILKGEKYHH